MKTIIITGCTRSGLTLMMQMLYDGGYPCFRVPPGFEDYNLGCIDFSKNKGKAIKLVDTHLQFPPLGDYFVIRLRRNLEEQSKSIIKFLRLLGHPINSTNIPAIKKSLTKDYKIIDKWANKQSGMMVVDFEDIINKPKETLVIISDKINFKLDPRAVDCVIHRETKCYDGMLETQIIKRFKEQT